MRSTLENSLSGAQALALIWLRAIRMGPLGVLLLSVILINSAQATSDSTWRSSDFHVLVNDYLADYINQLPVKEHQKIDYSIKQLDDRIQFTACDAEHFEVTQHPAKQNFTAGRISIKLECTQPVRWRLYIPVSFSLTDRVVILKSAIKRGTAITRSDLSFRQMDVAMHRQGYFTDIGSVLGQEAKQFMPQGSVVSPHHLRPPRVVRKQQTVAIISKSKLLTVKSVGVALSDGRTGELIKVRNRSSNRILEGQVTAQGQVEITY